METLLIPKSERLDITSLSSEGKSAKPKQQIDKDTDMHEKIGESEVQLLRMRTKTQEIIIFPDAKFLCCVVQAIGKLEHDNGDAGG
jgi:hypothetical protein